MLSFVSCLEKKMRKRKTRRGKKKNRKFLIKVPLDQPSKPKKDIAGDVEVSECHSLVHNQKHSFLEITSHHCGMFDYKICDVTAEQHAIIAEHNAVPSVDLKKTDVTSEIGRRCYDNGPNQTKPDSCDAKDLTVLLKKANGEQ